MGFRKPPVVEAWIEFRFALTQEVSAWDKTAAENLITAQFQDFRAESFSQYTRVEIDAKTGDPRLTEVQSFFDRIRAFSPERDRCVQAGRDILVFNQLNKGKWPGYQPMCDEAMEAVVKYMGFRDLNELAAVGLHYRDVVSLPRDPGKGIRMEDWFRIYPTVPDSDFGTVSAFNFSVQLPRLCERANAIVSIRSLPSGRPDDSELRFSVDWHVNSADRVEDLGGARQWLDSVHKALRSSFDKAFTQKCLRLFEPSEGE